MPDADADALIVDNHPLTIELNTLRAAVTQFQVHQLYNPLSMLSLHCMTA
jgi:hypothetical protein